MEENVSGCFFRNTVIILLLFIIKQENDYSDVRQL